jgi:predicted ATPase
LAWKGEDSSRIGLELAFLNEDGVRFEWKVSLEQYQRDFVVRETLEKMAIGSPPSVILQNDPQGNRWWWSESSSTRERLSIESTACALGIAAKNEGFPGRSVYDFVRGCVFCDPNPGVLKRPSMPDRPMYLDIFGGNLAARLRVIRDSDSEVFERIRQIVVDVTGVELTQFDVRDLDDGRLALSVQEQGLRFRVNQPALSNGTLRILALAVALTGAERPGLFAVEEPENYVHPTALEALVRLFLEASERSQVVLTTHSPLVLDCLLDRPEAVCVVSGAAGEGTRVTRETSRDDVLKALDESGFSLGAYWLSRGFKGTD